MPSERKKLSKSEKAARVSIAKILHELIKKWNAHLEIDVCGGSVDRHLNQRFFEVTGPFDMLSPDLKQYLLLQADELLGTATLDDDEKSFIEFRSENPRLADGRVPL